MGKSKAYKLNRQLPVPDWQKAMIDECLAEIEKYPGRGMTGAEFKKKLRDGIRQLRAGKRLGS